VRLMASAFTAVAILSGGGFLPAASAAPSEHVIQATKEVKWGPAPPMVPPGAEIAVVSGNPFQPVPYTVRLKFPANYAIPAHSHPTDENVVVVSGAVTFGIGDKLDKSAAANKTIGVGGYALVPANHNHFAYTTKQSTIVLYGIGPVDFKYVNPADDPRNAAGSRSK
jgi:quercetin dioxygenase-like cupin family protein